MTALELVDARAGGPAVPRWSAVDIAAALRLPPPTEEQRLVIEAPPEPLLVVAGAGSGKTETMSARVVWLVANGLVAPDEVLGLTFTRKAAGELAARIRRRLRALQLRGIGTEAPAGAAAGPGAPGRVDDGERGREGDGDPTVSTYHAYAGRVLGEHALRVGVEPHARLLSEASAWQLAAEVVTAWPGPMDDVRGAFSTVVEAVLALAGECAEHLVEPDEVVAFLAAVLDRVATLPRKDGDASPGEPYAEVRKVLAALESRRAVLPIVARYLEVKRSREVLDFGDQLALAAQLARRFPEVGEGERSRFRVVLLDEYQDTSHAQLVLLSSLFSGGHPVTAVGDPSQSIYGWRGASAGTLQRFPEEFLRSDGSPAEVAYLSTSWRNDRAVLTAANVVSRPLRQGSVAVPELRARPDAGDGLVRAAMLDTVETEAESVADLAERVWRADDPVAARGGRRRTVAVLCRKRSQFLPLETALRGRGLPVEVVGLGGLLSTPEVADVVATLQVLHDPTRGDALMRLLTGPRWRIGPRDLEGLARWARRLAKARAVGVDDAAGAGDVSSAAAAEGASGADDALVVPDVVDERSIVEALDELPRRPWRDGDGVGLSPAGLARLQRLAAELRGLRARTGVALPELVVDIERTLLLDVEVAARPGASPGYARAHLDAFLDVAAEFADAAGSASIGAFLAWLEAADARERGLQPGDVEVTDDAIQLLTVHASKGLEWDVVAVPGMVEGVFPACGDEDSGWLSGLGGLPYPLRGDEAALPAWRWRTVTSQQELEEERAAFRVAAGAHELAEERRLAYVAVTRARSLLLLTGHRWGDATKKREVSRFVQELLDAGEWSSLVEVGPWADGDDDTNPRTAEPPYASWPADPIAARRADVEAGASLVLAGLADDPEPRRPASLAPAPEGRASDAPGPHAQESDAPGSGEASEWAEEIALLLAERAAARPDVHEVALPAHVSTSRLVRLAEDPVALAREIRRPVPSPPRPAARRGTAFHAWLEQRYGEAAMVDLLELPGAADDTSAHDDDLEQLKAAYLASEWADRVPAAVEVPFETPVGSTLVRGRADAVFVRPDGGFDVVDWKSGRPPTGAQARSRAVQLAVYRLAWSRLRGVPLDRVSAAFFYAGTGETVRPVDLLDEAGLLALLTDATSA